MDDISQYSAIVVVTLFLIKEMFTFLRTRKNGGNYKKELADIHLQLSNHMNDYNRELSDMKTDIKIIKEAVLDIKLRLK